ncbi:hypothetical protein [Sphingosinicella sp. CPCC 101087]|uniref:hypothetical protein n=1 Tax=Sphingosinicella sp. CPCC 101087 TaxID=2497754 RepID=UPI00101BC108|nr:hypothetical protein [Sphingosinicella sp. CPCC 101087]
MRSFLLVLVLSTSASLLGACGQQGADDPQPASVNGNAAQEAPAAGNEAASDASLWNGGAELSLDIQSAHPNGVVLQLTSIQSRPTETVVGMRVINGRDREIALNRYNRRSGYIVLDSGERLYLSPPASNTNLSIPAGQTLEGELVFLGRLPPVRSAVLILNENGSTDSEYTALPAFRIDLPLGDAAQ